MIRGRELAFLPVRLAIRLFAQQTLSSLAKQHHRVRADPTGGRSSPRHTSGAVDGAVADGAAHSQAQAEDEAAIQPPAPSHCGAGCLRTSHLLPRVNPPVAQIPHCVAAILIIPVHVSDENSSCAASRPPFFREQIGREGELTLSLGQDLRVHLRGGEGEGRGRGGEGDGEEKGMGRRRGRVEEGQEG